MNADRTGFCRSLKDARSGRELTLEAIADSSKIGVALLADLERGDFSRWPKGIFRRAFLREYAAAIGLSPEHVVGEALRLFPEEGGSAPPADPAQMAEGLRLALAPDRRWWLAPSARRGLAACLDVTVVLFAGTVIARLMSGSIQLTTAVVGLTYYWAATLCSGATPASLWLDRRRLLARGTGSRVRRAVIRPRLVFSGPGPSSVVVTEGSGESETAHELTPRVAKSG